MTDSVMTLVEAELEAVTKERDVLAEALNQAAYRFLEIGESKLAEDVYVATANAMQTRLAHMQRFEAIL